MGLCSTPAGRAKARGKCPPVAVAKEFLKADQGRHFSKRPKTYHGI